MVRSMKKEVLCTYIQTTQLVLFLFIEKSKKLYKGGIFLLAIVLSGVFFFAFSITFLTISLVVKFLKLFDKLAS